MDAFSKEKTRERKGEKEKLMRGKKPITFQKQKRKTDQSHHHSNLRP